MQELELELDSLQVHIWCAWAQLELQGQSHGRQFLLKSTYKTSSLKSSVCAKIDGLKTLLGIGIAYCVARSWPTTLLEPVALRAGERSAWA